MPCHFEVIDTLTHGETPVGANWQGRLSDAAYAAGYDFNPIVMYRDLHTMVERHGVELVERAWMWYIKNAARLENDVRFITPKSFARKVGYWIAMSGPVQW